MNHLAYQALTYLSGIPEITALVKDADFVGLTFIESEDRLESFLEKMFAYRPALIRLLYRLRAPLVPGRENDAGRPWRIILCAYAR